MLNLQIQSQLYRSLETHHGTTRRRMMRLPAVVMREVGISRHYHPKIVSIGPFHHGKPNLYLGQSFKAQALETFIFESGKDKAFFYDKILQEISAIRACYDDASVSEYDDQALTEMMLLDGCFLINHMEALSDSGKLVAILDVIGMVGFSLTVGDMFLIENQIPFRVINLLITLKFDVEMGTSLLNKFFNFSTSQETIHRSDANEPLHLLEALRQTLTREPLKPQWNLSRPWKDSKTGSQHIALKTSIYTSRSVTDLKAKGIYFSPSPTSCLKDVTFKSHGILYARLQLPPRCISNKTAVLFSNLIAYELSPNNVTGYTVTSYVNLMKSLIHCAKDVKELRERCILISNLGSDEDVLKVLKELNTYGVENTDVFHHVKERIEEHYRSRAKTWMAELIHTYFESPWTAIALLAGFFLLCLTFAQTFFTIRPSHA